MPLSNRHSSAERYAAADWAQWRLDHAFRQVERRWGTPVSVALEDSIWCSAWRVLRGRLHDMRSDRHSPSFP